MRRKYTNSHTCKIIFSIILGVYFPLFLWNFWTYGYNALGIGAMAFGLLMIAFYIYTTWKHFSRRSLIWIIPLTLIMLSLGLYTNPFIKIINIVLIPVLYLVFTTHGTHISLRPSIWSKFFIPECFLAVARLLGNAFTAIHKISNTKKEISKARNTSVQSQDKAKSALHQVIIGSIIFVALAITVIIPLLSSADKEFALIFEKTITWFVSQLSLAGLTKVITGIFLTFLFLGYTIYWSTTYKPLRTESEKSSLKAYSPLLGTILIGIIGLYVIFITIQAKNIFIGTLPIDFKITETLVKSGFWQLFILTVLNAVLYIGIFGKVAKWVQYTLGAFTVASLLLLFSAAQRVYLYVVSYGLSYEKFFALYTTLFCIGAFCWFLYLLVAKSTHHQIFRTLSFAALWLYAIATVYPLERFILQTNLELTQRPESRIDLNELQMLSFDAIPTFERNAQKIIAQSKRDHDLALSDMRIQEPGAHLTQENRNITREWLIWHRDLVHDSQNFTCYTCKQINTPQKKWHEKTFSELLYKKVPNIDFTPEKYLTWKDPYSGYSVTYNADALQVYSYRPSGSETIFGLKNTSMRDAMSMHIWFEIPETSIKRFYFNTPKQVKDFEKGGKNNKKRLFETQERLDKHVASAPTFRLGNTQSYVFLGTKYSLLIPAPDGYFEIATSYGEKNSKEIQHNEFTEDQLKTREEFLISLTNHNETKEMISSFKIIEQDHRKSSSNKNSEEDTPSPSRE